MISKIILSASKNELSVKIDNFGVRLDCTETNIKEIDLQILRHELTQNDYKVLAERVRLLEQENVRLKVIPESLNTSIASLEEKIEERTNPQLRETLVFKNIVEMKPDESYDDTKELLAKVISENVKDVTFEYAKSQIKRAHRESLRPDNEKTKFRAGKRIIYAAFFRWELCEKIKLEFRIKSSQDREFKISVWPLTRRHRAMALDLRKDFKRNGQITGGFVDFPARLMVNFHGEVNEKTRKIYKLHISLSLKSLFCFYIYSHVRNKHAVWGGRYAY